MAQSGNSSPEFLKSADPERSRTSRSPGILFYDITTLLRDPGGLQAPPSSSSPRHSTGRGHRPGRRHREPRVHPRRGRRRPPRGGVHARPQAGQAARRRPFASRSPSSTAATAIEIHDDAVTPGQRVLIVDDVLATGGTARAAASLVKQLGGTLHALSFLIELDFLNGREKLAGERLHSVLHY